MKTDSRYLWIILIALALALAGCKKKGSTLGGRQNSDVDTKEVAAVRDAITVGMVKTPLNKLTASDRGKTCVVTVWTPDHGLQLDPPPPPPGMIRSIGQTVICRGQLDRVSEETLIVRAAYPTSGNEKKIELNKSDIQTFHLAQ